MNHQADLVGAVVLGCSQAWAAAQQLNDQGSRSSHLKVFLEGEGEFEDQIRADADFVEFVRDRYQADVHILVTSAPAGQGRREYSVAFTGFGCLEGLQVLTQVGVAQRGKAKAATAGINRQGSDASARDRHPVAPDRGTINA